MASATQQTERRRAMRKSKLGKKQKKARVKAGTPKFPIHPEGKKPAAAKKRAAKPARAAKPKKSTAKAEE
jgi:hypothetical protein